MADDAGHLVRLDGRDQSHVDLADPEHLVFDYVRRMGDVLDQWRRPGDPVRVVHVGGGGLTLPRYVAATRPRSSQVVLEPDARLTDEVRRVLPLPARSGIRVRPVDGRSGIAALRAAYAEIVAVDAFDRGRVPPSVVTVEFWADVARVLDVDGWLLLNLTDRPPWQHTRRVVAGVRVHLPRLMLLAEPATLKGRRHGNLVLVASRAALPDAALRRRTRSASLPARVLDEGAVTDSFGGGTPFTDADAEAGPPT